MPPQIPAHIRPINFAGIELILDLLHELRGFYTGLDLEALLVLLCVSDATMRPFMLDPKTPTATMCAAKPPEEIRGSISRRLIADKTGLPRETVRRRILELSESGHVTIDEEGRIRIAQGLYDPRAIAAVEQGHAAVLRYFERLKQLGVDPSAVAARPETQ